MTNGQSQHSKNGRIAVLTANQPSEGNIHQWDEREIKFQVPSHFAIPDQLGTPIPPHVFTSTYFDSTDHRLGKIGITLRKRIERGRGVWQLKIPSGDYRIELEIESGSRHIPWPLLDLLPAFFRKHEPVQLGKLRTWRTGRLIEQGTLSAEITLDSVALLQKHKIISRFQELELELKKGQTEQLKDIRKTLEKAGAQTKPLQPKIFQALHLPYPLVIPALDPQASPSDHIQARLHTQITQMLFHDPGTRLGRDSEALHQMRVATRRVRALLRCSRRFWDVEWNQKMRREVGWIGSHLGEVRDWDVLLESLGQESSDLPSQEGRAFDAILNTFQEKRSVARAKLLEALRSDRYLDLLNALEDSLTHLAFQGMAPTMEDLSRKAFSKLENLVNSTHGQFPKQELHHIRILVKRARYTVELAKPFLTQSATRFIQHAKNLQEALGHHQDALVIEHQLLSHKTLSESPEIAFVKGILVERFRHRQILACQNLPQLWKKLRKSGRKLSSSM